MNILGITFGFHESAACLLRDGELVFASAEERFTRQKQDSSFPVQAMTAALDFAELKMSDIDHVAIGWPRPIETYRHDLKLILTRKMPSSVIRWQRLLLGFAREQHRRGGELDLIRAFGRPKEP